MSIERDTLLSYCDELLDVKAFTDYAPNGLQVEGRTDIGRIVSGVTASQALLDAAVAFKADAVLVHHGYFWKGEDARITGMKRKRLATLLAHEINLIAYHLPLDGHPELGNNAQWARALGLIETQGFIGKPGAEIGRWGLLAEPVAGEVLAQRLEALLGRAVLHVAGKPGPIRTVGLCSGGAQGYITEAVSRGLDAYLTGEVSEHTVHVAREMGIHFYACGHHASERFGVRALGEHLAERFGLTHHFIDIDNPA
ncbi:MAG: Nif3-like dinuclear metal center hexameric protein [Halothiobacillaceae bacterium]